MSDHMFDLILHGHCKEGNEINQKNRPEDGDVEEAEEGTEDGN